MHMGPMCGFSEADLLGGALREEDVHERLVGVKRGSLGERSRLLLQAGMSTLLHTHPDGIQAQQGVSQVGRPLLCLRLGELQNWQRLPKRL